MKTFVLGVWGITPNKQEFDKYCKFSFFSVCVYEHTACYNCDVPQAAHLVLREAHSSLASAKKGAETMRAFEPDVIIALGGGSAMDIDKIMWVLYEHPEADFMDMAMRFIDIRKRVYTFLHMDIISI